MEELGRILLLLEEKRTLFAQFEEITEGMLSCPAGELEESLARRERLIAQIDGLDRSIRGLAGDSGREEAVLAAVSNRGDRGDLPEEVQPLYDAAAQARAIASRLTETETQVGVRLRLEQERILELIKSTNRGAEGQAARFLSTGDREPQSSSIARA